MPKIQNVSRACIEAGCHLPTNQGNGAILIQISDPDVEHPIPFRYFERTYQFKFLDIEESTACINPAWRPGRNDAYAIASILLWALDNHKDVVVHCHAGICRSGAVAEAGEMLGFEYAGDGRQPNVALKLLLLEALGLGFDPNSSPFNQMAERNTEETGEGEVGYK